MKLSRSFKMLPLAALMLSTFGASVHAADAWVSTNTRAFAPGSKVTMAAVHTNALAAGETVNIVVALQPRNKPELDAFTSAIASGRSTNFMSKEQYMSRHAPTAAQVQAVVDHLRKSGYINIQVTENNLMVSANGTAATAKTAFNTELHNYTVEGRQARANISDAQVPASLAGVVTAVHGLQTVHSKHTTMKPFVATNSATPQAVTGHNPTEFAAIYGASSLPVAGNTAVIGVITQGSMTQTVADLKSFASKAGYPVPTVNVINVDTPSTDTSGVGEWNMDTQSSLAAAGGTVKSLELYTASTLDDAPLSLAINKAVTDNKARAINVSLGECETDAKNSGAMASWDNVFQQAMAQGQVFSVSTGDSGSQECTNAAGQSNPATSPYVMAIGGTTLNASSTTYSSESVWSGGGGGPSIWEPAPAWQTASGVLGTSTFRGVPDISFDADPNSGALVLVKGANQQIGGTSLSAPIFAGFWTRIQAANGNTLPFPAATLYQKAAANPSAFHDVTTGNNGGYTAKAGWDYATGYGSVNVANFAKLFAASGALAISSNPASVTVAVGGTASFAVGATGGTPAYGYQWYKNGAAVSGATAATYSFVAAASDNNATVYAKVSDSKGASVTSSTATVTVGSTPVERVTNGGFESGATGWTGTTAAIGTWTGEAAASGSKNAWLGGNGTAGTESLYTTVSIPAGAASATLSFALHIDSAETTTTTAYDKLTVSVQSSTGTLLKTLATYSNVNKATGYSTKTFDLSAYKGQTVRILFSETEDSSLQTSFVIDNVSVK